MIDDRAQVKRLLPALEAALPLPARLTPEVATMLRARDPAEEIPFDCAITWVSYAGDEGGIVCRIDFGRETKNAAFASITHLRFDSRLPLAREIADYQRRRVKRLQRQRR